MGKLMKEVVPIYQTLKKLNSDKILLSGKKNKHKRNKINSQVRDMRYKEERSLKNFSLNVEDMFAPGFSKGDRQARKIAGLRRSKECSVCRRIMHEWKGCRCKERFYCQQSCANADWKNGHKHSC